MAVLGYSWVARSGATLGRESEASPYNLKLAHTSHDITGYQMFFVSVILDHGWVAYMWDMLKEIHVLDSLCAQVVGGVQRHMIHHEAVSQIHSALFSCLQ